MSWLTGSKYRKLIAITGQAGAGADYQVPVTVNSGAGVDAPGVVYLNSKASYFPNDIHFTAADGSTLLSHWIDMETNVAWVKVAADLDTNQSIYIYYGLSAGAAKADPTASDETMKFHHLSTAGPAIPVGAPGAWDDFWVSVHSVVKSGSTYYAFYHAMRSGTPIQIGLATSVDDGATWVKHPSNPIFGPGEAAQWDDYAVSAPCVWIEGATWYMLYSGNRSGGNASMGLATSADGIAWTRSPGNPVLENGGPGAWDEKAVAVGTAILKEGSTYYLFYTGYTNSADFSTYKIGCATSTDLTSWTKYAGNPVLQGTAASWKLGVLDPHVRKFGSTYYMWFQGNEGAPDRSRIGLATSADLSAWTAVAHPICESESETGWDNFWHETPKLVDFGTHWRLFYSASQGATDPARMQEGMAAYIVTGDPESAFLFYDHFDRSNGIDATKWSNDGTFEQNYGFAKKYAANTNTNYILKSLADFAYPIALHTKCKDGSDFAAEYGTHFDLSWDNGWASSGYIAFHHAAAAYDRWGLQQFPGLTNQLVNGSIIANTFYALQLRIAAADQYLYVDGAEMAHIASVPPQASTRAELITGRASAGSAYTTYFDYIFARKFTAVEPAVGTPAAEEQLGGGYYQQLLRRMLAA